MREKASKWQQEASDLRCLNLDLEKQVAGKEMYASSMKAMMDAQKTFYDALGDDVYKRLKFAQKREKSFRYMIIGLVLFNIGTAIAYLTK
jgi:cell division septum initiation protein DivIVA